MLLHGNKEGSAVVLGVEKEVGTASAFREARPGGRNQICVDEIVDTVEFYSIKIYSFTGHDRSARGRRWQLAICADCLFDFFWTCLQYFGRYYYDRCYRYYRCYCDRYSRHHCYCVLLHNWPKARKDEPRMATLQSIAMSPSLWQQLEKPAPRLVVETSRVAIGAVAQADDVAAAAAAAAVGVIAPVVGGPPKGGFGPAEQQALRHSPNVDERSKNE